MPAYASHKNSSKVVILRYLLVSRAKMLLIITDMLFIVTRTSNKRFSSVNIDDFKRP